MASEIVFCDRILDNVHGFIPYTEAEKKIIQTQLFKRLQSIKQLSVANWVFPGSEHTRYSHSLGVMHIADKIAVHLDLPVKDRKILRLAGLLHDIGHYPLSHVCEAPYRNPMLLDDAPDDQFCSKINEDVRGAIESFSIKAKTTLMKKSDGVHHEAIGAQIIRNNSEIRRIITTACDDESAPDIIADIIIGNVERPQVDPLLVQIIHSELDADGIDYLMRDAAFSGTSFGSVEIEQIIRCMTIGAYNGKRILCIEPKAIVAADQYLVNKFFSYSQVVFNKHIAIYEWMAMRIVDWMQKHHAVFPSQQELETWAKEGRKEYLDFTDHMFWSALSQILNDKLSDLVPHYIKVFCECLLHHNEPDCIDKSEIRFITQDTTEATEVLKESQIVTDDSLLDKQIAILNKRSMTKQVPIDQFKKALADNKSRDGDDDLAEDTPDPELLRLMECVSVCEEDGSIHLLCDDKRSLMRTMYNSTLVVLRCYEFPQEP